MIHIKRLWRVPVTFRSSWFTHNHGWKVQQYLQGNKLAVHSDELERQVPKPKSNIHGNNGYQGMTLEVGGTEVCIMADSGMLFSATFGSKQDALDLAMLLNKAKGIYVNDFD